MSTTVLLVSTPMFGCFTVGFYVMSAIHMLVLLGGLLLFRLLRLFVPCENWQIKYVLHTMANES